MNTYNIHNGQGAFLCEVQARTERGAIRIAKREWSGDDLKASIRIDYKALASALGRIGGSKTSEAKTKAVQANGRLGGRPKQEKKAT